MSSSNWKTRAMVIWMVLFTLATGYSLRANRERITDINNLRVQSCIRIDSLLQALIAPQLSSLPTLSYYKQHPKDLKLAIANTKHALTLVDPRKCEAQTLGHK